LAEVVKVATENVATGDHPFAAIIINKDKQVIASIGNSVNTTTDPSAHSEMNAIRQACKFINGISLEGCTLYSSCEPCPMCLCAIQWSKIDATYYAAPRGEAMTVGFNDSAVKKEVSLPFDQRSKPVIQIHIEGTYAPFQAYKEKHNKE
jgi:guanine deaminase